MEIKDFSDLSDFVYNEYAKMSENFGIQQPSVDLIKLTENKIKKYFDLYSAPLFRQSKRDTQLLEALNTRPHGFIWKLFHSRLWAKIKVIEKQEKLDKELREKSSELDIKRVENDIKYENQRSQAIDSFAKQTTIQIENGCQGQGEG